MKIKIDKIKNKDEVYLVIVKSEQETRHHVRLPDKIHFDMTKNKITKLKLIEFSFIFLLERENNSSILSNFDLQDISRYFPEYLESINKLIKN